MQVICDGGTRAEHAEEHKTQKLTYFVAVLRLTLVGAGLCPAGLLGTG